MLANRSIPNCTVIPELAYPDIGEAIDWLCNAFGFTLRIRIADHRAQLNVGDGAVILIEQRAPGGNESHAVMVRVENVDRHHERASRHELGYCDRPPTFRMANGNTMSKIWRDIFGLLRSPS